MNLPAYDPGPQGFNVNPLSDSIRGLGDQLEKNRLLAQQKDIGETIASGGYGEAADKSYGYGDIKTGTMLTQAEQADEDRDFNRNRLLAQDRRSAASDARSKELHGLKMQEAKSGLRDRLVKNVAGIAQMIRSETDPSRKAQMTQALINSNPRMGQELSNLGFDPANPDAAMDMIIAEARGMTTPSKKDLMTVSPGSTVYDPIGGQAVFKAPDKPGAGKKFTEGQAKAANFANMMVAANQALEGMAPKGPDGRPLPLENPKGFFGATRDALVPGQGVRNVMTSGDVQAYNQTAKQWIRAKLRKESGAVIGEQEMEDEFRTYFPQYGDGPEVIARKAAARAEATKGMLAESGGAYQELFPPEQQTHQAPQQPTTRLRYNPATGELE